MNKPESPFDLANWAKQSVEARVRFSNNQNAKYDVDSRISQERRLQLIHAFKEIDRDGSGKLSYDEILAYLKEINDQVSDSYVKTIFESMDENHDGQVSIEEFISTYLNQVNALSEASARLRQQIQERKRELASNESQYADALKNERINSWGIMEGSLLTMRVIEAQNLSSLSGKPSTYVNILCEKQQIATKVVPSERNPLWNEEFSFRVAAGNGEMLIQVFNQVGVSKDELLGTCSIPLEDFKDQKKHEKWFHLQGVSGTARILLSVQWIHRKTQYLKETILMLEKEIEADSAEEAKILEEMMKLGTNPSGMFKKESWVDKIESKVINEVSLVDEKYFEKLGSLEEAQRILLAVFTVLAALGSIGRPDLVNLTWVGAIWKGYLNGWTIQTYRYGIAFLVFIILYDFVWAFASVQHLVFSSVEDYLAGVHKFVLIVGVFGFLLKAVIIVVMVKNFVKFKEVDVMRVFNR